MLLKRDSWVVSVVVAPLIPTVAPSGTDVVDSSSSSPRLSSYARWGAYAFRIPEFADLIDGLRGASPEVQEWWPRHEILPLESGTKRLRHPTFGDFTFRHVVLLVEEHPDQKLVTFSTNDRDEGRLAELATSVH